MVDMDTFRYWFQRYSILFVLTFVASVNPVLYQDAAPVLIDSEMDTWNMTPQALERALKEALKNNNLPIAVIVVHLYGQECPNR